MTELQKEAILERSRRHVWHLKQIIKTLEEVFQELQEHTKKRDSECDVLESTALSSIEDELGHSINDIRDTNRDILYLMADIEFMRADKT